MSETYLIWIAGFGLISGLLTPLVGVYVALKMAQIHTLQLANAEKDRLAVEKAAEAAVTVGKVALALQVTNAAVADKFADLKANGQRLEAKVDAIHGAIASEGKP